MFVYPNELQIKNQPKHCFEIYEHNLDWLKVLLSGEGGAVQALARVAKTPRPNLPDLNPKPNQKIATLSCASVLFFHSWLQTTILPNSLKFGF